jgi:hypothetical protein
MNIQTIEMRRLTTTGFMDESVLGLSATALMYVAILLPSFP